MSDRMLLCMLCAPVAVLMIKRLHRKCLSAGLLLSADGARRATQPAQRQATVARCRALGALAVPRPAGAAGDPAVPPQGPCAPLYGQRIHCWQSRFV